MYLKKQTPNNWNLLQALSSFKKKQTGLQKGPVCQMLMILLGQRI
jgi:hypothetical protein